MGRPRAVHPLKVPFAETLDFFSVLHFLLEGHLVASAFLSLPWFVGSQEWNCREATEVRVEGVGFEISDLLRAQRLVEVDHEKQILD